MVNQKLLDYIKQQFQQGFKKEEIEKALLTSGWQKQDIEEGFNAISVSASPEKLDKVDKLNKLDKQTKLSARLPMKIWKIIIIFSIGVLLIGGGIYLIVQKFSKPTEKPSPKISHQLTEPAQNLKLSLNIATPKDTYNVGEKFTGGKCLLSYSGVPFKAIVLYKKSRKGFEDHSAYNTAIGTMSTGTNPEFAEALQAFKMDKNGYEAGESSFQEPGEYIFTMSVYKCSDIGLKDENCTMPIPTKFILKFKPLKSVTKIITVVQEGTQGKEATSSQPTEQITKKTVLDCIGVKDPQCTLNYLNLFKKNLELCKISTGTTAIGWEPAMGVFRGYKILGVQNNLCVVKFWFLKTKDLPAEYSGKQMTCKYSASERTIQEVSSGKNCTGPLLEEINKSQNN